jgi:hypothetical protein
MLGELTKGVRMDKIIAFVVALVLLVLLYSCMQSYPQGYDKLTVLTNSDGIQYQMFTIEGMPCVRVGNTKTYGTNNIADGVSCDWSKWKGN